MLELLINGQVIADLTNDVIIGSRNSRSATLHLDDRYVSILHARISRLGSKAFIEDLGSTNGTYLNSGRVMVPTLIRGGDIIKIGRTQITVQTQQLLKATITRLDT